MSIYKIILTKDFLIEEYIEKQKSINQIAKEVGCKSRNSIVQYLDNFNITRRKKSGFPKNKKQTLEHIKNRFLSRKGYTHSEKTRRKISLKNSGIHHPLFGKKRPEHSKLMQGINNPNYINGESHRKYSSEFNNNLKEQIRKRDNYICQNPECNMTEEEYLIVFGEVLTIHHIDYNKFNNNENNLITLCKQCNIRANYNRDYWKKKYISIMEVKNVNL